MKNNIEKNIGEAKHTNRNNSTIKLNLISIVIGIVFIATHEMFRDKEYFSLFSVISTFIFLALLLLLTLKWYKSLDEFEKRLFGEASLIAFYTGLSLCIPWVVLERYGFVQDQLQSWVLIFIMGLVLTIYYYGKKFLSR